MSSPVPGLPPIKVPHGTVGVLLVGLAISCVVYGITCAQAIQYFRRFRSDLRTVKAAVAFAWILETLNTCLTVHTVQHYAIQQRYTPNALTTTKPWSLPLQSSFNATLSSIIHILFTWRIYILSRRNKPLAAFIMLLSLGQLICGCAVTVVLLADFDSAPYAKRRISLWSFGFTAMADMFVAGCLTYYLHIIKTGNTVSNGMINRIIAVTVNSGALSSSIACVGLFTALASPQTYISFAACFVLGRAYFNALLSSLNARKRLRDRLDENAAIGTCTIKNQLEAIGVHTDTKDLALEPQPSSVKEKNVVPHS